MIELDFSFGESAINSDAAANTIQKAGCCRNSTLGIAVLLSGYGRRRQRLDEFLRQKAQCLAGEGAMAKCSSVLRMKDAD